MNGQNDIYKIQHRLKETLYLLPYLFAVGIIFGIYDNWEFVKSFFGEDWSYLK